MASHSTSAKQAATAAVLDLLDAGSDNAAATLSIKDGATLLIALAMSNPAFGSPDSDGIATADTIEQDVTVAAGDADTVELSDRDDNVIITITDLGQIVAISGVDTGNKQFVVAGDETSQFTAARTMRVVDSSGNDGKFTVASSSYDGGDDETTITVEETIPDGTADGEIHPGEFSLRQLTGIDTDTLTVISSLTYQALPT